MTKHEIGLSASDTTVRVAAGTQLRLTLPETRTAGYSWRIVSDGSPILAIEDGGFTSASGVGGAGLHRWTLNAVQNGTATLEMVYGRSWQTPPEAKQRFTLTIEVE
jgi:inhibitor of cysteine peptidase